MLSALKKLPRSLEATYDRILERVVNRGDSICNLVQRALIWILGAGLTVQQLCEAVSIDIHAKSLGQKDLVDAEDILISCSSLIRISADRRRLESAHFTVVEYLTGIDPARKPHLARFRMRDDLMNIHMAETCLTVLTFDNVTVDVMRDSTTLTDWLHNFPFYHHAAITWPSYEHGCRRTAIIAALTTELFLDATTSHYQVWAHVYLLHHVDGSFRFSAWRYISIDILVERE